MSEVLAQLMAQAAREGSDLATMRAIAEEAGELSAMRALKRLGLADEAAAGWLMRLAGALVLTGLAVELGFRAWLE